MKKLTTICTLILTLCVIGFVKVYGQDQTKPLSLDNSPVEDQFNYVYQRSADFEDSKLVKRWHLTRLKSHVLDTIQQLKMEITNSDHLIGEKNNEIDSLLQVNASTQVLLEKAIHEKHSLSFLGMALNKNTYNSIVWTLIGLLVFSCTILILLYKRSNSVTSSTRNDLADIKQDFEAFRKRALEREEGIVRKYHDELNKFKNKAGKLS